MFSIIQRNRHHRSNIYSGAPMPYMQRLTWSGIALHQGALPGYPASHGCIRLPEQFANFLWNTTKMNTRVIVSRDDVEPQDIVHAKLFQPKPVPTTVESPLPELRKTFDTTHPSFVRTAGMTMVVTDAALAAEENWRGKPLDAMPAPPRRRQGRRRSADVAIGPAADDAARSTHRATSPSKACEPKPRASEA